MIRAAKLRIHNARKRDGGHMDKTAAAVPPLFQEETMQQYTIHPLAIEVGRKTAIPEKGGSY